MHLGRANGPSKSVAKIEICAPTHIGRTMPNGALVCSASGDFRSGLSALDWPPAPLSARAELILSRVLFHQRYLERPQASAPYRRQMTPQMQSFVPRLRLSHQVDTDFVNELARGVGPVQCRRDDVGRHRPTPVVLTVNNDQA